MPETAAAAVLTGPRSIELTEFPLPSTGPDDALLRIEACGGCGSDVGPYLNGGSSGGMLRMRTPLILGHEIVGRVERLGERAAARWGVVEGDRIIIERWIPCGHCDACYGGDYRLCVTQVDGFGLFYGGASTEVAPSLWGGFAEYLYLHPNSVVYKVGTETPAELYPLFTPIGNGISWLQMAADVGVGDTVVIEGPGPSGLGAVVAARAAGAHEIIVTGLERDADRLAVARRLGATHTIAVDQEDAAARVGDITAGRMADVVLEVTSGANTSAIATAVDLVRQGGTVILAGGHAGKPAENLVTDKIVARTLTVKGVWGRHRNAVRAAVRLIESGDHPLDTLITHEFPLSEVAEAMETVAGRANPSAVHVSVTP
jgi:threonine dehydrogenase-like Zn-dependent dehydrogenase